MTEIIPMFDELPVYQEDLDKIKAKKPRVNCLQEIVIELMDDLDLRDSDIIKGTNIPWPSFHGWITGDVNCQLADKNLLSLFQFFKARIPDLTLEYMIYGTGAGPGDKDDSDKTA